jgi:peroxiredoxin
MKKIILMLLLFSVTFIYSQSERKVFEDFKLLDYNGKSFSLSDFKNSKAIVIIFVSTRCPVSNEYNARMEKIYRDYRDKGIAFVGINSNKEETVEEISEHAKKNNLSFIILKDYKNKIADKFKASYTPEVFVLNSNFELLYHGRIDDSRKINNVKSEDLRRTLDEILAGKEVSVKETKAFGCTIKRVEDE